MVSRVDGILRMVLDDDDDDWVQYGEEGMGLPLPYHSYPRESGDDDPSSNGKPPKRGVKKHPVGADASVGAARLSMPDTRKMTSQPVMSMTVSNAEYSSTSRPKSASRKSRTSTSSINDRDDRLFAGMQSYMLYDGITSQASSLAARK